MKVKNFSDITLLVTCYSSFCLTVFLLVHGLSFIPTSSHQLHKALYEVLVSVLCTLVMDYLVQNHLNIKADQLFGLNELIIAMNEKLKMHPIVSFCLYSAPAVIGMQLIVDRPWTMGVVTVSLLTFVMCGCSLYTTPRAAAIVARPIINVPVITVAPVIFRRGNKVVLGLLLLLAICCYRSLDSNTSGIGVVLRTSNGNLVNCVVGTIPGLNPLSTNLWAVQVGLRRAFLEGALNVIIETDNMDAYGAIQFAVLHTFTSTRKSMTLFTRL